MSLLSTLVRKADVRKRFRAKIKKRRNGCWLWCGARNSVGYGIVTIKRRQYLATHVALELSARPRPTGKYALHARECTSRACVNPAHLRWGTQKENMVDAYAAGVLTGRNNAKLTLRLTAADRLTIANLQGVPMTELARRFRISAKHVSLIRWVANKQKKRGIVFNGELPRRCLES
jgi:hypothetical protein